MLAPVLLHSAAGPLSAAASLPTPGPPRWQLLRAKGKGATACGRWWGLPSGPLGRPTRPQRPAGRTPAHPGRRAAARPVQPPAGSGRGNVAARAGPLRVPSRSSWPPAVARGTPPAKQGQAPAGPLAAGLALLLPRARLRRRCSGAARPPQSGGCGAVRPSGPALRAGVAARGPSLGVPPPSRAGATAAGCCAALAPAGGRNLNAARYGPASGAFARFAGGWGAKIRPLRRGI